MFSCFVLNLSFHFVSHQFVELVSGYKEGQKGYNLGYQPSFNTSALFCIDLSL